MAFLSCRAAKRTTVFIPLLLAMVLLLALAQTAAAAPPEPTMDLEQLATALESGPLSGHLLTTMRGTTPEEIPVMVESLVDYSWGTLILFEATGPQIDRIGGIAAGMSGSPVYVDDAGTDKLDRRALLRRLVHAQRHGPRHTDRVHGGDRGGLPRRRAGVVSRPRGRLRPAPTRSTSP